ncbi:MAG: hypothetical protein AAF557_13200 [Pseudomonadota bacterium]
MGIPVLKIGILSLFVALPVSVATSCVAEESCRAGSLGSASARGEIILAQANETKSRARRGDFDAEGQVSCAQERGESLSVCKAAVARGGGGDAAVAVTFSNGFTRYLYFEDGAFVRASTTMSGSGKDIDWNLGEGLYTLRVDDQRFELPSEFVLGQ